MQTPYKRAALSAALPFLGAGGALVVMLSIAAMILAHGMMSAM